MRRRPQAYGRKGRREMEWAIVFGALCTVEDCAWQRFEGRLLIMGGVIGAVAAGRQLCQGTQTWYGVLAAFLPGAVLWAVSVMTEGRLGRGDGDMVLVLGLFLGWKLCAAVLCTACLLTAIAAGAGLAAGKLKKSSRLPFAPFLLAAMALVWVLSMGEMGG